MSSEPVLTRFYRLMDELRGRLGGFRQLSTSSGSSGWPVRGVYFFFDPRETRGSGFGMRVVRVGTHAVSVGSSSSLWGRLSQHQGTIGGEHPGGGNHRGSVFRMHVGNALLARGGYPPAIAATWPKRGAVTPQVRQAEYPLERNVSEYIRSLPLLWLNVNDEPSPGSDRRFLEVNSIGLLSSRGALAHDPPSPDWLGYWAVPTEIRHSRLWNIDAVGYGWSAEFLDKLERYVAVAR